MFAAKAWFLDFITAIKILFVLSAYFGSALGKVLFLHIISLNH